jgi:hypothetical protein
MSAADHALMALLWYEFEPSAELTEHVSREWDRFREQAEALGFDPEQHAGHPLHSDCEGDPWAAVAHDLSLTRNGHGTGFWDSGRWVTPWGQRLTNLAHSFGELTCELNDAGEVFAPDARAEVSGT